MSGLESGGEGRGLGLQSHCVNSGTRRERVICGNDSVTEDVQAATDLMDLKNEIYE